MQAHVERIARQAKALGVLCAITSPEIDHLHGAAGESVDEPSP